MLQILKKLFLIAVLTTFGSQASAMWIQPDWFEVTEPGVGTNRYAYSGNDPVNRLDPGGNQSTISYITREEYQQAADDTDDEIARLEEEWGIDPRHTDKWYEYNLEQLKRNRYIYGYYAEATDQQIIDSFRQDLVRSAAGAIGIGLGTQLRGAPTTMPRRTPVVGSVPQSTRLNAPTVGGGAKLRNLTPSEIARIQNAANRGGVEISVVGSRANASATALSDWDYVVPLGTPSKVIRSLRNSLPSGYRELGAPRNIEFFRAPVERNFPHITFRPSGS